MKILFVCLGNICRSPLAEASFNEILVEKNIKHALWADSAGTAGYHIGKHADQRAIKVASKHGIQLNHIVLLRT